MIKSKIAQALSAMSKLMTGGERIDETSGDYLIKALSSYDDKLVLAALDRCFKELKFFPSFAEIIDRIDDGRPGTEEAWSLAPKSDHDASYVNDEIISAWQAANSLLRDGGDMISARMAFKEIYERTVKDNRAMGVKPKWWLTRAFGPGSDHVNEAALRVAVEKKRLTAQNAVALLPTFESRTNKPELLTNASDVRDFISNTMKQLGGES